MHCALILKSQSRKAEQPSFVLASVSKTKRPISLFTGDQTNGADQELHFLLCENDKSETETEERADKSIGDQE